MKRLLRNLIKWWNSVKCNRCGCYTPFDKCVSDVGYDDWGYQCIACATDSGLLKENQERTTRYLKMMERRKEFGL